MPSPLVALASILAALVVLSADAAAMQLPAPKEIDAMSISLDSLLSLTIVSAAKHEQTTSEAPASVTIITDEDIRMFGWQTLLDVLSAVCGLDAGTDLFNTYVGSRGFNSAGDPYGPRILLMLDEVPIREAVFGQSMINEFVIGDIRSDVYQIEVVRGPGSSLYGTGAMLAVVNVVTKRPGAKNESNVLLGSGDHGRLRSSVNLKRNTSDLHFSLTGSFSRKDGRDFHFPDYDSIGTSGGVAHHLNWKRSGSARCMLEYKGLHALAYYGSAMNAYPTAQYGTVFNDANSRQSNSNFGLDINIRKNLDSNAGLLGRASFQRFYYHALYPYDDPYMINFDSAVDAAITGELRFNYAPNDRNSILAGTEVVRHIDSRNYGWYDSIEDTYSFSQPFTDAAAYVQDEFALRNNVTLTGGLRYARPTEDTGALTPRCALVWEVVEETNLKFLYGEAFRAPSVFERQYEFPDEAIPNPDLAPERIRTFEAVLQRRMGERLIFSTSAYRFDIIDLISAVTDEASGLHQFRNLSSGYARGLEFDARYRPSNGISAYLNYAYQDSRDGSSGARLPNAPYHVFKGGISAPIKGFVRAGWETRAESSRLTLIGSSTAPFAVHNFTLSTGTLFGKSTASLRISNLFDTDYSFPGSYDNLMPVTEVDMPGIPQPRRSISLTVLLAL